MSNLSKADKLFIYAIVVMIMMALFLCVIAARLSSLTVSIANWTENGCYKNEIYGIDEEIIYKELNNKHVSFLGRFGISLKMRKETG